MSEGDQSFEQNIINTVQNHMDRVAEGKKLLGEGKPLTDMQTKPFGLTGEQNDYRRHTYTDIISQKSPDQLQQILKNVEFQLERRLKELYGGSSELEWQRNEILRLLEEKK